MGFARSPSEIENSSGGAAARDNQCPEVRFCAQSNITTRHGRAFYCSLNDVRRLRMYFLFHLFAMAEGVAIGYDF
jgi:hypothetical protein